MSENNDDKLRRLKSLGKLLDDEELRFLAVKKLKQLLNAKKTIGLGGGESEEVDDCAVQAKACQLILAYTDGPPDKYIIINPIGGEEKERLSDEQYNEAIARALRLPPGSAAKVVSRKMIQLSGDNG